MTVLPARWPDPIVLADSVLRRDRTAIASALNLLDDRRPEARERARIVTSRLAAGPESRGHVIGITGPPGSGKSSLTSSLIGIWRAAKRSVGVLAVDPSSPRSGGALLGDRIRMLRPEPDGEVFVRSLASRGQLGGLSPEVWPMGVVMLAAFDVVVVETVGIGQSEVDIADVADTTCCVVQPASGDTVQFLKSGIMEVPDVFAVNKADLGVIADRAARELKGAIPRRPEGAWAVPVKLVSATAGTGMPDLAQSFDAHRASLGPQGTTSRRLERQARWVLKRLREEFGSHGVERAGGGDAIVAELMRGGAPPLARHDEFRQRCLSLLGNAEGERK
jgi:LAO/AO transport system kinase